MNFTSDNATGASPEILAALAAANDGPRSSYGGDDIAQRVEGRLCEVFETDLRAFFVITGTAANALALASLAPPWGTVFCHEIAHIAEDECGAPQFFGGGLTLHLLPGANARIEPDALRDGLRAGGARGVHQTQPAALSLTNITEYGALYTPDRLASLAELAKARGCRVHLDGTRFANAVIASAQSPAELSWKAGVDVLCLGATKNGALAAEAVIFFEPDRQAEAISEFEFRRKRGGHLVSKGRLLSAQFDAYLTDDLWLRNARHSNAMGARLAQGLHDLAGVRILNEVAANMVFAELPAAIHRALLAEGASYYLEPAWQDGEGERIGVRLVCGPQTGAEEVDAFVACCARAAP